MCESVLSDALNGKIQLETLIRWISRKPSENGDFDELTGDGCSPGDFVSFFLNYIHETQVGSERTTDTPQKSSVTPVRIEHNARHNNQENDRALRRQSALFPELPDSTNKSSELVVTPKANVRATEDSYASPVSPLYNVYHTSTPRYSSPRTNLCLGDFITHAKSSTKKHVQRNLNKNVFNKSDELRIRRINPTNVTHRKSDGSLGFRRTDNSFNFNDTHELSAGENPEQQRSVLMEERLKIMSVSEPRVPIVPKTFVLQPQLVEVYPSVDSVTFQAQLQVAARLYSFLLSGRFVLNPASELYFLVSLLLAKDYGGAESADDSLSLGVAPLNHDDLSFPNRLTSILLKTIHNRVYFALKVLEDQLEVLKLLDSSTLRLLTENKRVKSFAREEFISFLVGLSERKCEKLQEANQERQRNVCFISDTDNRDNFPSTVSFHAFRKQRDLFYDILWIWEKNRVHDEWSFGIALGGKIKALVNMHGDPANYAHLARLFKAQLLMNTCKKGSDDTSMPALTSLPHVNAEKLSLLKNRILTKPTATNINSVPHFSDYQEFYKEFILAGCSHVFNLHLRDCLVAEIHELNEMKFSCSDLGDVDYSSLRKSFLTSVKSLRVLGKFLGFLEGLPYRTESVVPQNVLASHLRIRNQVLPVLNLHQLIESSIRNRTLVLAIPWITEYLANLDYVTLRLAHYEDLYSTLFKIYHADFDGPHPANGFMIRLCLGWLFELPHFPENLYYDWLARFVQEGRPREDAKVYNELLLLDELEVVDVRILYTCCPYLDEIKKVLSSDANNAGRVTVKYITPLVATQSSQDSLNKRLQQQLEENFYNGQPASVRKTVEFISERVASACVRRVYDEIVPEYRKEVAEKFRAMLETQAPADVLEKLKEALEKSHKDLRSKIDEKLRPMISDRVASAIDALLAADVLEQTKKVCVAFALQACNERTTQWIKTNISSAIFLKDFIRETQKFTPQQKQTKNKPVFSLPTYGRDIEHNPCALCPVDAAKLIRSMSLDLLENKEAVTLGGVDRLLDALLSCIRERRDLNECILVLMNRMLVDFVLLLICHRPDLTSNLHDACKKFIRIWKGCPGDNVEDLLFKTILCPKNVELLNQSDSKTETWWQFGQLITLLMQEGVLSYAAFDSQASSVKRLNWNEEAMTHLTGCLRHVKDYQSNNATDS